MNTAKAANHAKFDLAVDYELRARFWYDSGTGIRDRRLAVEDYDGEYVRGQSFDESGNPEGYRQFIVDNIVGPVTVR